MVRSRESEVEDGNLKDPGAAARNVLEDTGAENNAARIETSTRHL